MSTEDQKDHIERAISRARDGVGDRIDELDAKLRTQFNIRSAMREHAGEIVASGAVLGFLAGFGFPKLLRRAVFLGIPVALVAMKVRSGRNGGGTASYSTPPDYEI